MRTDRQRYRLRQLGVCGKDETTSVLQDLLVHAAKGVAIYAHRAAQLGQRDGQIDGACWITCFPRSPTSISIRSGWSNISARRPGPRSRQALYEDACTRSGKQPEQVRRGRRLAAGRRPGRPAGPGPRSGDPQAASGLGPDVAGLQELVLYGLKGHGCLCGTRPGAGPGDPADLRLFHEALDFLAEENPSADELLGWP